MKAAIFLLTAFILFPMSNVFSQQDTQGKWKLGAYNFASKKSYDIAEFGTYIEFTSEMRFGGSTGCNSYGGQFARKDDGTISAGDIISTDRMCPGSVGEFEAEYLELLGNVRKLEVGGETLTLTDTRTGHFLRFTKDNPADAADPVNEDETETIFVANRSVRCKGIEALRCMLVKKNRNAKWENYYDTIMGFDYKPGLFYKLKVKRNYGEDAGFNTCVYRHELVTVLAKGKDEVTIYR
jgi:heat shock protein HslJ